MVSNGIRGLDIRIDPVARITSRVRYEWESGQGTLDHDLVERDELNPDHIAVDRVAQPQERTFVGALQHPSVT